MPKKSKKLSRSEIMKAAWAKRKRQAAFDKMVKEPFDPVHFNIEAIKDEMGKAGAPPEWQLVDAPEDSNPVATHLENELRRRDKEIIADFVFAVRQVRLAREKFDPGCRAILVSDSVVDAIVRALSPQ